MPTPQRPIVPSPTPSPTPPSTKTTPTSDPSIGPNRATSAPSPTSDSPKLRTATVSGGQAMFYYTPGQVDLLDLSPCYGYSYEAYRLENDYIVVRFVGYYHISTIYAYWSKTRQPTISVYEEDY
ncbi:hypothetical protein R8Z50_27970 [Longispora sp. K20-0274]|uniref:hypothetical protein n=1 Tax=Longispora sp. K20-0274 TaxID=3088255 RepID=UPI00399BC0ED